MRNFLEGLFLRLVLIIGSLVIIGTPVIMLILWYCGIR